MAKAIEKSAAEKKDIVFVGLINYVSYSFGLGYLRDFGVC